MEDKILAHTDFGTSNTEIVPLIYFLEKSDEIVEQFDNMPFYKMGFTFVIISVENGIGFYFKNQELSLTVSVHRKNIVNYQKFQDEKFDAVKTSYAAGLIKRSQATAGAGGLIPSLIVKGATKLISGNGIKTETHEGPIYKLFYLSKGKTEFIKVACEKSYELDFEKFLNTHWITEINLLEVEQKKEGCFIATACYGSYECDEVRSLRSFRDKHLSKSIMGSLFIKFYYKFSPPVADFIRQKKVLKAVIRNIVIQPTNKLLMKFFKL
jgi:hypothetical protein